MLVGARDRITIQTKTSTLGPTGTVTAWTDEGKTWGRITPFDSRRRLLAGGIQTEVSHVIGLRGRHVVLFGTHRITHGGRTFEPTEGATHHDGVTTIMAREVTGV